MLPRKFVMVPYEKYAQLTRDNYTERPPERTPTIINDTHESTSSASDILTLVPRSISGKSRIILGRLESDPILSVNSKLELVLKGKPIPNSNIVDLLKYVQYSYKSFKPAGHKAFVKFLVRANIPKTCYQSKTPKPSRAQPTCRTQKWIHI